MQTPSTFASKNPKANRIENNFLLNQMEHISKISDHLLNKLEEIKVENSNNEDFNFSSIQDGLKTQKISLLFHYIRNNQNIETLPKYYHITNKIPNNKNFVKSFVNQNKFPSKQGFNSELESLKSKVNNGDNILDILNEIDQKSLNKSAGI